MLVQWFRGVDLRVTYMGMERGDGKGNGRAVMAFTSLMELDSSAGISWVASIRGTGILMT